MNREKSHQRGGILVEYAIATAILVPIFIIIGVALQLAIQSRGLASVGTVEQMTPINPHLSRLRQSANSEDTTYLDEHGTPEIGGTN